MWFDLLMAVDHYAFFIRFSLHIPTGDMSHGGTGVLLW